MSDTPEHDKRNAGRPKSQGNHPEISRAYDYTDSVIHTEDGPGYWYGWALREAFLAGISYARNTVPVTTTPGVIQILARNRDGVDIDAALAAGHSVQILDDSGAVVSEIIPDPEHKTKLVDTHMELEKVWAENSQLRQDLNRTMAEVDELEFTNNKLETELTELYAQYESVNDRDRWYAEACRLKQEAAQKIPDPDLVTAVSWLVGYASKSDTRYYVDIAHAWLQGKVAMYGDLYQKHANLLNEIDMLKKSNVTLDPADVKAYLTDYLDQDLNPDCYVAAVARVTKELRRIAGI